MTVMKRIISILFLFVAVAMASVRSYASPQVVNTQTILRTDTVTRTDTIMTKEVIRRYDVIQRVEELLRVDTILISNGQPILKRGMDLPSSFSPGGDGLVKVAGDSASLVIRDSINAVVNMPVLPKKEGGDYVWVPDSLLKSVDDLLSGNSLIVKNDSEYDERELVIFRGDTIPMMLRDRNFGRFDRGLFNYLFIPKGMWQIGITASYGKFDTEDLEVLDLLSDIDLSGSALSIKPYFSYFIRNNMSVGMRLAYTTGKANIDSFQVDIDEDMNFNLKDIMYRGETYSAALTFNQYFGIARRGRFGVFNEVELAFGSGNSDFRRPYNGVPKVTHTMTTQASLNFSPGLCVFIMEQVSFNVSFGVFGFCLRNEKQTVDGVDMGSRFTSRANFRFNFFNINFGIGVNF